MMNTRDFSCSLDKWSKVMTALNIVAIPAFVLYFISTDADVLGKSTYMLVLALPLTISLIMFPFSPRTVGADKEGIYIRRLVGLKRIPHANIIDVRLPEEDEMRGAIRTFGNGGLFGYTGYYRNSKVGSMLWFCTRRSNYVLVTRATGPVVVVTPDDPQGFVAYYKSLSTAV
jgi:hypothetical protein